MRRSSHTTFEHFELVEITDLEQRQNRLVSDYMALSPEQRQRTLILAGTNQERLALTAKLRQGLKQENCLGKFAIASQLKAKDLTTIQACYSHYCCLGGRVIPLPIYSSQGLQKGQL